MDEGCYHGFVCRVGWRLVRLQGDRGECPQLRASDSKAPLRPQVLGSSWQLAPVQSLKERGGLRAYSVQLR